MSEFDAVSGFRAAPVWGPVPDAPPGWSWSSLMHKALGLAREAASVGEVPVGALVVDDAGNIVPKYSLCAAPPRTSATIAWATVCLW